MKSAVTEDNIPFKKLVEIENLRSIQLDLVSKNVDAASFTDVNLEAAVVQPPPSDAKIVVKLLET